MQLQCRTELVQAGGHLKRGKFIYSYLENVQAAVPLTALRAAAPAAVARGRQRATNFTH